MSSAAQNQQRPLPPDQPASGPGGADYRYREVKQTSYGEGSRQFQIFEPEPRPQSAPCIAFLHGWGGMDPSSYRLWIEHIVKRGNIVIYPRYQENLRERAPNMTPGAIDALRDAFQILDGRRHTRADRTKFALVGHSLGGVISANIAARAAQENLPEPSALMVVQPGDNNSSKLFGRRRQSIRENYESISSRILLLVVVGDEDRIVGTQAAKQIFQSVPHIPAVNKEFLMFRSNHQSSPPLLANHFSPLAPLSQDESRPRFRLLRRRLGGFAKGETNALDFHGYWKLFDALTEAAFYGKNREYMQILQSRTLWETVVDAGKKIAVNAKSSHNIADNKSMLRTGLNVPVITVLDTPRPLWSLRGRQGSLGTKPRY
ncbi:MAG: alpha/beta hydrolase fold domain-containing protein [Pyrinomonadaceae bacterium]|nr:alpha/beta hydrolase fold domain-containing protein [Pyrinomonadaceae bacterium]